jgi:hypothetical protein
MADLKWQAEFIAGLKRNGHTREASVLTQRFLLQQGDHRNPKGKVDQKRLGILVRALETS